MLKNKKTNGFTQIPNSILNNPALSLASKGLLAILLSNAKNWKIRITEIYRRSSNSEKSQRKPLNELVIGGYITQKKVRNPQTKTFDWVYKIDTEPSGRKVQMEIPLAENETVQKPSAETMPINNTDINNINSDNTNKKEETGSEKEKKKKNNSEPEDNLTNSRENHTPDKTDGQDKSDEDEFELPF
jgi:hypothetical protein